MTGDKRFDQYLGRRGSIIAKQARWGEDELRMAVKVIDVRRVYGRTELLIVPVASSSGEGQVWVAVDTLELERTA